VVFHIAIHVFQSDKINEAFLFMYQKVKNGDSSRSSSKLLFCLS